MAWIYDRSQEPVEGGGVRFLSKAGWVRLRVSRMDAATEPTGTYLQRPPQPDPPRLPSGNQLLLLLGLLLWPLPLRVQGAALPN